MPGKVVNVSKLIAALRDSCQHFVDVVTTDLSEDMAKTPPGVGISVAELLRQNDYADDVQRVEDAIRALDALKPHLPIIAEAAELAYLTLAINDGLSGDPVCDRCGGALDMNNEFETMHGICGDCNKLQQQKQGESQ
jgi:hypothetical protein